MSGGKMNTFDEKKFEAAVILFEYWKAGKAAESDAARLVELMGETHELTRPYWDYELVGHGNEYNILKAWDQLRKEYSRLWIRLEPELAKEQIEDLEFMGPVPPRGWEHTYLQMWAHVNELDIVRALDERTSDELTEELAITMWALTPDDVDRAEMRQKRVILEEAARKRGRDHPMNANDE